MLLRKYLLNKIFLGSKAKRKINKEKHWRPKAVDIQAQSKTQLFSMSTSPKSKSKKYYHKLNKLKIVQIKIRQI